MIIIQHNKINLAYAENNQEFTESLFTKENCAQAVDNKTGTLALFYKINKRKHDTLYWIDDKGGYFIRNDGLAGQFGLIDGKKYFQVTLANIWKDNEKIN